MKKNSDFLKKDNIPIYPLRSVSKLNHVPESMVSNAKSLVQTGYLITSSKRTTQKREKLNLPERKETNISISKILEGKYLAKLVGEE